MKLLIRKCSESHYWYQGAIGQIYDVLTEKMNEKQTDHYPVDVPGNTERYQAAVMSKDCLVFEDKHLDKVKKAFDVLEKTLEKYQLNKKEK